MKKGFFFICLVFSGVLFGQVPFNGNDLKTISKNERDASAWKLSPRNADATASYDVKWYRCLWNIDPSVKQISGSVPPCSHPLGMGLTPCYLTCPRFWSLIQSNTGVLRPRGITAQNW